MKRTASNDLESALEQAAPTRAQWSAWARREPALAGLTYEDLHCELRTGGQDLKDKLLGAFVRVAHADRDAFVVVAACLLPGLRHLVARYAPALDRQEAVSVLVCALFEVVTRYDAEQPRFVASALLALPTRRLRRAALEERRWIAHIHHDSETAAAAPTLESASAILASAVDAGVVTDQDAQLILDTRVAGYSLHDVARRLGLRYEAAKKRRQRAETRWASWWTDGGTCASHRPGTGPLRGENIA